MRAPRRAGLRLVTLASRRRSRAVLIVALAALFTGVTPGALADQDIVANTGAASTGYTTPNVTMAQGEKLTFQNNDATVMHNVTSKDSGPDGQPLFHSATIGGGGSSFVEGSQYLTTGTYHFYCTLHPNTMTGTLTVSTAGTPVPRPGGGGGSAGGGSSGGGTGAGNAPAGGGNSTAPSKTTKKKKRRKHHRKRTRGRRHSKRHRSHG